MSPLIGLVGAWVFIIVGMIMKGGTIAGIISPPAFMMVVDGTDPELVKDILETELDAMDERHHKNQDMFKQGGAFAPTIGILATVLSLVGVLQHLDEPEHLGPAISAAFLATFYGVAAANIVFLPIANALKKKTAQEA